MTAGLLRRIGPLGLLVCGLAGCVSLAVPDPFERPASLGPLPLALLVIPRTPEDPDPLRTGPRRDAGFDAAELSRVLRELESFEEIGPFETLSRPAGLVATPLVAGGRAKGTCVLEGAVNAFPILTLGLVPVTGTITRGWSFELFSASGDRLLVDATFLNRCWIGWLPMLFNVLPGWTINEKVIHRAETARLAAALRLQREEIARLAAIGSVGPLPGAP